MDLALKSFINNTRLIRKPASLGYTYVWSFEDEFGQTLEMGLDKFSHHISDNLAKLRVKQTAHF